MRQGRKYWWIPRLGKIFTVRNAVRLVVAGFLSFLLLDLAFPLTAEKSYSQRVYASDGSLQHAFLSTDDKWRLKTRLSDVPPEIPKLLIAKEDQWFWHHPGVNPFAIVRAAWGNFLGGKRSSGASTITMQVARMLAPKRRTLSSKLIEAFRAFQLEWHHSKPEILEMYMSYLPYGGNVEGIQAASHLYFDRQPGKLSLAQCMLLAVIPNRPNSLRPDHHPDAAKKARDKWLKRLAKEGCFPVDQLETALMEPLPSQRLTMPANNPQLAYYLRKHAKGDRIQSTVRPQTQKLAEDLLSNHIRRLQIDGIGNGALMVLDNATMEVLAYCGSADFENKAAAGEMDATKAIRSPGSTLKPFVYALALDQGLITPKMKLLDIPSDYAGFAPVNYDKTFQGEVAADDALRHSLNIPAVRLLRQVGLSRFLDQLSIAGFESISRNRSKMGLSVALGGCGATLFELVRAYAALANGGQLQPIKFFKSQRSTAPALPICSPEAAYMITAMLAEVERPDLPAEFLAKSKLPRIAWKTGTSFGRRDAWAVGYNPRYTVGVWMGNMDGSTVLGMSGSRTAVPLMLEVFNAIDYDAEKTWFPQPEKIRPRQVCKVSGKLPAPYCNHLIPDIGIAGVSPTITCTHAMEVLCDPDMEIQYCTACVPAKNYIKARFPAYSPTLALWMERFDLGFQRPPPHNPACEAVFEELGPQIYSPAPNATYLVEEGKELLLQAAPTLDVTTHYWYEDGNFLGSSNAGEKFFFAPQDGKKTILCMDDKGRKRTVTVKIEIY